MTSETTDDFTELSGLIDRAQAQAEREREAGTSPDALATSGRKRRRRRLTTAAGALLAVVVAATYVPVVLMTPIEATAAQVDDITVAVAEPAIVHLPEVGASAVAIAGVDQVDDRVGTDGLLAASGGEEPRPIASITKLIAAMVILDSRPLSPADDGPTITFSKADADLYDHYYVMNATVHAIPRGSTMTEREALEVMLVISATNYAHAVSLWAFGSLDGFRAATADWLAQHGLSGTTIVEPTGMDARNTSTPADLLAIGRMAMADPVVADIVGTWNVLGVSNTNSLLRIDGINGIKTGTLDAAGACLLFSAVVDVGASAPLTVIGVVLGGDNHYQVNNAVRALIASIRDGFHEVPLIAHGDVIGRYLTPWGEEAAITSGGDADLLTWSDQPINPVITVDPVTVARGGEVVGELTFSAGARSVRVPMTLDEPIEGPDAWWRLTHPDLVLGTD